MLTRGNTLGNPIISALFVGVALWSFGLVDFRLWSFMFSFIFAWPLATFIARRFARDGRTGDSEGRYVRTGYVYLWFVMGIIFASWMGSLISDGLIRNVNPSDSASLFLLSLTAAFLVYFQVRLRLY